MKKFMNKMFLSCLKATELIEKRHHFKLTLTEKIQLKVHKAMCDACTMYEKQSIVLDKALGSSVPQDEIAFDLNDFKKEIMAKIEKSK
ncbi:MAG: hypothetical protein A2X05_18710 [Bacteroidetes bacterium GWE2_41_25]|nr:MAG: hypothetical protein A2X03_12170 [Bacteroidetes bacterium GWA2_40_15]OFX93662.1 MAG: hypothetical protein A2X06_05665 [Bacteroidetes bacterium GWC2_40_22]OFY01610.1 MAG: hypothetical protein A2X05_18710 [Bacteroidetes bacterium GWE2_41_25]OFY61096.1 MAG: hypothetical protein A2X04_00575 [Bacteroidetes bacterium GWF2_41_9]HBH83576.1 hypothetical protein [Bacteroidales bacterium]